MCLLLPIAADRSCMQHLESTGLALIRMGSETTSVASGQELAHREDRPEQVRPVARRLPVRAARANAVLLFFQTISAMGSFALITNNVIGPGIMSLPALFKVWRHSS